MRSFVINPANVYNPLITDLLRGWRWYPADIVGHSLCKKFQGRLKGWSGRAKAAMAVGVTTESWMARTNQDAALALPFRLLAAGGGVFAAGSTPISMGPVALLRPLWLLLGLSKSFGGAHEGDQKRDRGDRGNRTSDKRAEHSRNFSSGEDGIILLHDDGGACSAFRRRGAR